MFFIEIFCYNVCGDNMKSLKDFLPISTKRLIIRKTLLDDVNLMLKMDKQEDTQKFLGGIKNKTKDERIELLKNKEDMLTVLLKDEIPIGFVGIKILDNTGELSYMFDSDYWKNGYCNEACKSLIDIAFNKLNLDSIFADTLEDNYNSIKVLERIGFIYEKSFIKNNNTFNYYVLKKDRFI